MTTGGYIACVAKEPKHPKVAAWARAIMLASGAKSQEAIAERLGVSRSGFAKWFYGDQRPSFSEFHKLEAHAAKLGVPAFNDFDPSTPTVARKTNGEAHPDAELESAMMLIRAALADISDRNQRRSAAVRALSAITERAESPPVPGAAPQPTAGRQGPGRRQVGSRR